VQYKIQCTQHKRAFLNKSNKRLAVQWYFPRKCSLTGQTVRALVVWSNSALPDFRPRYGYRRKMSRSAIKYMPSGEARKLPKKNGDAEKQKRSGIGKSNSGARKKDTKLQVKSSRNRFVIDSSDEEDRNGFGMSSPVVKTAADSSLLDTEEDEVIARMCYLSWGLQWPPGSGLTNKEQDLSSSQVY